MRLSYKTFFIQQIACICFIFLNFSTLFGQGKFIANMGQWEPEIISQAPVKGGTLFLCRDMIRYNFLDHRDVELLHKAPFLDSFAMHGQSFFAEWIQPNPEVTISSRNEYPEYYNYFLGNDPTHWKSKVHAYSNVDYKNLYRGINLYLDASGDDLEYTYEVMPGIDPHQIKLKITGAEGVFTAHGDLKIVSPLVTITEKSPFAYQLIGNEKIQVPCNFTVSAGNIVSFSFPEGYDKSRPLTIDPVVIFATYSGSKADNFGFTGTYDQQGHGYSGGDVYGAGFPTTAGAWQQNWAGGSTYSLTKSSPNYINIQVYGFTARDVGILKYSADGKNLLFATYLGGKTSNEQPHSMVVDKSGNLIVIGTTASTDFPVTSGAYSTKLAGKTDIFVSKLSADGSALLASTYIGGTYFDGLNGIDSYHLDPTQSYIIPDVTTKLSYNYGDQFRGEVISDNVNNIYVATSTLSNNFPTTTGSYQPTFGGGSQDGVVFKMDSALQTLIWSTYLGGNQDDGAYSLQLDSNRNVFVCGGTLSPYFFPTADKSYQQTLAGDVDGYICHLKNDGSGVIKATYFGTAAYDQNYFVQLDKSENVYVYGQTESSAFLVTNVKYSNPKSGNYITKFDNGLNAPIYSTVFGAGKGRPDVSPTAFLVDKCEKVYISGWGGELYYPSVSRLRKVSGMPITPDAFQKKTVDSSDFYVSVFERNIDTLLYASYFGGDSSEEHVDGGTSRFDKNGIMYQSVCGGCGGHSDFPTTPGAWSRTNNSDNCNNLLFKVDLKLTTLKASFIAPTVGCKNVTLSFLNTSTKAKSYLWDFGDSTYSAAVSPKHLYKKPGPYTVRLIAMDPNSCEVRDTFTTTLSIYSTAKASYSVVKDTCGLTVKFIQTGQSSTNSWDFGDGSHSTAYNVKHTYPKPGTYTVTLLTDSGTACADTFKQPVTIKGLRADFKADFLTCKPEIMQFTNLSVGELISRKWYFPFSSTDTAKNPLFNFNAPGTYAVSLVVNDSFGCKDSVTKNITAYAAAKAGFAVTVDSCAFQVYVFNQSVGVHKIHWTFSDGFSSDSNTFKHIFNGDSTYKITLIAEPGSPCADTFSRSITFHRPVADFKFTMDTCSGKVQFINQSARAVSYLWKFSATDSSSAKNPVFTFNFKGKYPVKLTIVSSAGCADTLTKIIEVDKDVNHKLFIPNVFTPNNDDPFNKKFVVKGLSPCYSYIIDIYNRWGQLMYHSSGLNLEWDGYYHGVLVPEGDYYYVFQGKQEGKLEGTITVIY
jgi:gliding motility-associated-like protein